MPLEEACKPTCLLVPPGAKFIELAFGTTAPGAGDGAASGGGGGSSGGGSDPSSERVLLEDTLKLLWGRVRATAESVAAARELHWTNYRLSAADGATIGAALRRYVVHAHVACMCACAHSCALAFVHACRMRVCVYVCVRVSVA